MLTSQQRLLVFLLLPLLISVDTNLTFNSQHLRLCWRAVLRLRKPTLPRIRIAGQKCLRIRPAVPCRGVALKQ